jgi:hypothetical protein
LDEVGREFLTIFRRICFVAGGRQRGRRGGSAFDQIGIGAAARQQQFGIGRPQRNSGNSTDGDARLRNSVAVVHRYDCSRRNDGEMGGSDSEFFEGGAGAFRPRRKIDTDENFVRLECRGQIIGWKFGKRNLAPSRLAGDGQDRIERTSRDREFSRRIEMTQAAADSAAIAGLLMADMEQGVDQERASFALPL